MREMRWTPQDLAAAAPRVVASLRWLLTAERIAERVARLEEFLAHEPHANDPDYSTIQFARADARRALDALDEFLMGPEPEAAGGI